MVRPSRSGGSTAKTLTIIAVLLIVLCIGWQFHACFWSREYAEKRALHRVAQLCRNDGRDPGLLSPARDAKVEGRRWAFEWIYQGQPRYFYGVSISRSGDIDVYSGDPDDAESAAYQPR